MIRAESVISAILQTFAQGQEILTRWRTVTVRLYPNCLDLLQQIPLPDMLTLWRLGEGGFIVTDTCNTAWTFRKLFKKEVQQICLTERMTDSEIHIFEADCWQHLRNIWTGAVIIALADKLTESPKSDLDPISSIFRVTTNITGILRAIEKYFGETANYAKGSGSMFYDWLRATHPGTYVYPIVCACGGSR